MQEGSDARGQTTQPAHLTAWPGTMVGRWSMSQTPASHVHSSDRYSSWHPGCIRSKNDLYSLETFNVIKYLLQLTFVCLL